MTFKETQFIATVIIKGHISLTISGLQ